MEGILCFISITLGDATEQRTTQLKTFKNFFTLEPAGRWEAGTIYSDYLWSYRFIFTVFWRWFSRCSTGPRDLRRGGQSGPAGGSETRRRTALWWRPVRVWRLTGGLDHCHRLSTSSTVILLSPHWHSDTVSPYNYWLLWLLRRNRIYRLLVYWSFVIYTPLYVI